MMFVIGIVGVLVRRNAIVIFMCLEMMFNAANLAFFLVNLSQVLLRRFQQTNPDLSILDLKAHYHGYRYAVETIKMLPEKPDAILLADIFQQLARLGAIHPLLQPSASP